MTAHEKSLVYQTEQRRYNFVRIWGKRYAHMKARAEGRSTNHSHASGKELISRENFFEWCKQQDNLDSFMTLWFEWAMADFPLYLSPSIDRINSKHGYVDGNLQWMSFADNCEKNNKDPITHKELRDATTNI